MLQGDRGGTQMAEFRAQVQHSAASPDPRLEYGTSPSFPLLSPSLPLSPAMLSMMASNCPIPLCLFRLRKFSATNYLTIGVSLHHDSDHTTH